MDFIYTNPTISTAAFVFIAVSLLLVFFDAPFVYTKEQSSSGIPIEKINWSNVIYLAMGATILWYTLPWIKDYCASRL